MLILATDVTSSRLAAAVMLFSVQSLEDAGIAEGRVIKVETYLDGLKREMECQGAAAFAETVPEEEIDRFLQTPYAQAQVAGKAVTGDNKAAVVKVQLNPDMTRKRPWRSARSCGNTATPISSRRVRRFT